MQLTATESRNRGSSGAGSNGASGSGAACSVSRRDRLQATRRHEGVQARAAGAENGKSSRLGCGTIFCYIDTEDICPHSQKT